MCRHSNRKKGRERERKKWKRRRRRGGGGREQEERDAMTTTEWDGCFSKGGGWKGESRRPRTSGEGQLNRWGGEEQMRWWDGQEGGLKVNTAFSSCCSVSVLDLVFSYQPSGISHTHTHTHIMNDVIRTQQGFLCCYICDTPSKSRRRHSSVPVTLHTSEVQYFSYRC